MGRLRRFGLLSAAMTLCLNGCAVGPVNGILFSMNSFAGKFNPANDVPMTRSAKGCQHQILGLVAFGNASAGRIAREAGIKRIAIIDHSTINVLQFAYGQYCTRVVGE